MIETDKVVIAILVAVIFIVLGLSKVHPTIDCKTVEFAPDVSENLKQKCRDKT